MSCAELLVKLRKLGARVWLEEERLRVAAPPGILTDELRLDLKAHREELVNWLKHQNGYQRGRPSILGRVRPERLPLSYAQQRLWFLYHLEGPSTTYNISLALRLRGELDVATLHQAITDTVARHEALRTIFPDEDGVPYQNILPVQEAQPALIVEAIAESEVRERLAAATATKMRLEQEPPLRFWLFVVGPRNHLLLMLVHHIIADAWSMAPLGHDIEHSYQARLKGIVPKAEPLAVQYADYSLWQRELMGSEDDQQSLATAQLRFWKGALEGAPEQLALPTVRSRPAVRSYLGESAPLNIDSDLHHGLLALARQSGASLFMVLLAGVAALLSRLGAGVDIPIGTVVAGRGEPELEALVGLFVNTLVLRTDLSGDPTFMEAVQRVKEVALQAYEHQEIPFEQVVEHLRPERSPSRHPLFQVMLNLQNAPVGKLDLPGLATESESLPESAAKFDLLFDLQEGATSDGEPGGLHGALQYSVDLFDHSAAEAIAARFVRFLKSAVAVPQARVFQLDIVSAVERHAILYEFNASLDRSPAPSTVTRLFEAQVATTPYAVALSFGKAHLTYVELNERTNRLAHYLMSHGVQADKLVGIALERSLDMVIAILGIWKAGAAYLPLDPGYPRLRLEHMIRDGEPALLVTTQNLRGTLPGETAVITLDGAETQAALAKKSTGNPSQPVLPQHPAYVIYTSGSTGMPKGVVIAHSSVVRLFTATDSWFTFGPADVHTLFHSYAFDFSVWEMCGALLYGGRLVIVPESTAKSPERLLRLLAEERVTVLSQTPSSFYQLMQAEEESQDQGRRLTLRIVVFGGEALELSRLQPWYERHGRRGTVLVNMYGITETTVHVSYLRLTEELARTASGSLIGGNIPDLRIYVLDDHLEPVAPGVVGEIYVAGPGLASGYLKRPALTAERFIAASFDPVPGARMYRTGDLGRWCEKGMVEYCGRADKQVKVRGFRIELGEIEAALTGSRDVAQAAVAVHEDQHHAKQLVAYVVPATEAAPDIEALRRHLREHLPAYMIPGAFVALEQLPFTANGKLDRLALPAPHLQSKSYAPPRSAQEEILCTIFADLLGLEQVSIHDDFFELGGHSLLAARLISRVRAALAVELDIRTLFESHTVAQLVERLSESRPARLALAPRVRSERLPLSFAQQRMWFLYRMEGPSAIYNLPLAVRLAGTLDVTALEQALSDVADRHEALRTVFPEQDGVGYQKILSPAETRFSVMVEKIVEADLSKEIAAAAATKIDLENDVPLRVWLFRMSEHQHVLLLVLHHVAGDGWSMVPLARDVERAYRARLTRKGPEFTPLPVQYADYTLWQRELLGREDDPESLMAVQIAFWRKALHGIAEELSLPTDRPRPAKLSYRGALVPLMIDQELHRRLLMLARQIGATLFMILQAGIATLLTRLGSGEDIPIGTVVAGRNESKLEEMVGLFVNTLVLRTDTTGDPTFIELVRRVRKFALEAYSNQEIPFERLVEALRPARSQSRHPIFQVVLVLQNTPAASLDLPGLSIRIEPASYHVAKFDLSFRLSERLDANGNPQGMEGELEYCVDLFDRGTAESLAMRTLHLLKSIVVTPHAKLWQLEIMTNEERRMLLEEFNARLERPLPGSTLVHLFESQVARTPDAPALSFHQGHLSYGELNQRANRLAHYLRAQGVESGHIVGISLERSADMVVSILGVLKAGAAYLPLDPDYPPLRLQQMWSDAAPVLVVTTKGLCNRLPKCARAALLDSAELGSTLATGTTHNPRELVSPLHAAYVMYTSGSTGSPKAVVVSHHNVTRLFAATEPLFGFCQKDVWTLFHSFAFDFSVWELWGALLHGGRLVVVPKAITRSPAEFLRLLVEEGVTVLNQTPSAFYQLLQAEQEEPALGSLLVLRTLVFGGEALDLNRLTPWYDRHGTTESLLINMYGITETTVHVSHLHLTEQMVRTAAGSLIGGNIPDLRIYVLDDHLEPVPVGIVGDLYVAGAGLADGYLKRPALTAERFVAVPFCTEPGARMYRTGDLGRWRERGMIEYCGRADQQVKVRGFRIELGEIEGVLKTIPGIVQAVAMDRCGAQGEKQLVAYVVPAAEARLDAAQLRQSLRECLPDYMIPSTFVTLERLPLTGNGKLDRRALPEPHPHVEGYVAPRNLQEEILCGIFADTLGVERVGMHDDFFELGGHSILAVRLVSRIRAALGVEVGIRSLFESANVADLAQRLRVVESIRPALSPQHRPARLPLSYAQQRLWFLSRLEGPSATYNIPLALRVDGDLNLTALEQALADVIARHETLRTLFPDQDGVPYQRILSPHEEQPRLYVKEIDESEVEGLVAAAAATEIDLERDLPLQVWVFRLDTDHHVLLLLLHHIAGDAWSMVPLARDLEVGYRARLTKEAPQFQPLRVQYADYTLWQRELLGQEENPSSLMAAQLEFWKKALHGAPELLNLPSDRGYPSVTSHQGGTVPLQIGVELHRGLLAIARHTESTLFMVLHAGVASLLSRLGSGEDIPIGTVVAGRNEPELEELVGFFVNTLVLRTDLTGDPSFIQLVRRVRSFALAAYDHQEIPFERLVEALHPVRSDSRHPLIQVMLVLHNAPSASLDLPGLSIRPERLEHHRAKFDLSLGLSELLDAQGNPQGIEGAVEYSCDLFDAKTVELLASRLLRLLEQVAADPNIPLHRLEMVTADEKQELLSQYQAAVTKLPTITVEAMFEAEVARAPGAIAVVRDDESVTYAELNERANLLAHYLISHGIGPESLVGIALGRSLETVIAVLATWKAGAAYLPLDPEYPQARLKHMLHDAAPSLILSTESLSNHLYANETVKTVSIDAETMRRTLMLSPAHNPSDAERVKPLLPYHPAYVIYTSGSTGIPKGVVVTHVGIPSLVSTQVERLKVGHDSRILQFASLNFDASLWELLMALTTGATLVLLGEARTGEALRNVLVSQKVTHALLPIPVLATLEKCEDFPLQCLINGGEALSAELVARWSSKEAAPQAMGASLRREVINAYGPTESTVCATISGPLSGSEPPPLGSAIANARVYVLDNCLQPVPVGITGELYVAGAGLARGYLNRAGLTGERFVADPFAVNAGERMYRTGDLARRHEKGRLEFIGRVDQQVKVRGFRIELGEIEAALRSLPEVAESVVVVRENKEGGESLAKQLVSYLVGAKGANVETSALRRGLNERLPAYMVPEVFVVLDALPLMPNGKIDRQSLRDRPLVEERREAVVPPKSEFEKVLVEIWKEVLGRKSIGIEDNFFDLGGHSLLLAQVHARLQKAIRTPLPIVKLFEHPTIVALADYLEQRHGGSLAPPKTERGAKTRKAEGSYSSAEVAIIGMACRFPGASSVETFWLNLRNGVDSISSLSEEELATLPPELIGAPGFVNAAGRVSDVALFDAAFFGLTPAEATATDPQQRLMLECAWEALESAGYNPRGQAVGVFAGAGESHYRDLLRGDSNLLRSMGEMQWVVGTGKDHIAPRLSYLLDLRGPSVPINTACSTSLVAVHIACKSLINGECEMALAGGVSLTSDSGYIFDEDGILSPEGRCRAFDAKARGTVPASGAALVVLKRLEDALADGDHIHAVIKGSAINNDGNAKVGYTAPSVEGQRRVIGRALEEARLKPRQISYIEAHGTGTPLGDPIEIEALVQAFTAGAPDPHEHRCAIGSVKTNIGHCDSASGIAGLMKAVLCVENGMLVPSLHFEEPNPQIDLGRTPFYVSTRTVPWNQSPRLAGVSSFGIGGTNAHVIVSEPPPLEASSPSRRWQVLTLSARTESALERKKADVVNFLLQHPEVPLADIAFTLNTGRRAFSIRQSIVFTGRAEAVAALTRREKPFVAGAEERPVLFLFPGQGKFYPELGSDLYREESRFREEVDRCCIHLMPLIGADLRELMFPQEGGAKPEVQRALFWQPAIFVIEYALAKLWMSWGIVPTAMLGHSLGEYVAATLAGVLGPEDALLLIVERARGTESLEPGAMLALPLNEAHVGPYIKDRVALAAINGPELCVLAGPTAEIDQLQMELESLSPIRLEASHAFHSRMVEPLMDRLTRVASRMTIHSPLIPYLSNVTGTSIRSDEAKDPAYWARHLRGTVRFHSCMEEALRTPGRLLLEVGPGKVLSELARRSFPGTGAVPSMVGDSAGYAIASAVGRLWSEGVEIDWKAYYQEERRRRIILPTYPFERQAYWVNTKGRGHLLESTRSLDLKDSLDNWFYAPTWKRASLIFKGSPQSPEPWVVFSDPDGIGGEFVRRLRQSGQRVHEVRRGTSFQQRGDVTVFAANEPHGYQTFLESLGGNLPRAIVYAWYLENDKSENGDSSSKDLGGNHAGRQDGNAAFDSLIYLSQALSSIEHRGRVRVEVVTSNLHRVLDEELSAPASASILGIVHVLPKEMPRIACQNIDVDGADASASRRLMEWISAEVAAESSDAVVAYRHGHRWTPLVDRISALSVGQPKHLREGGVYLVTHAMQEIGFALAQWLVRDLRCRAVLLDRSFFPRPEEWDQWIREQGNEDPISRRIARLQDIRESVTVLSADLAHRQRITGIKDSVEKQFGRIDAVLHLDRTAKTGLIQGKAGSPSAMLQSDLAELAVLEEVFSDQRLVLFSSNLAETGGIGQVEQCARAAVVALLSERRHANGKSTTAFELAPRAWTEDGESMDSKPLLAQQLDEKRRRFGMTSQECIAALERALALDLPKVIISTRDFSALMDQQYLFTTDFFQAQIDESVVRPGTRSSAADGRPDVSTIYAAPRNEVEKLLVELWKSAFRYQEIGIDDNFFELGGHSLLAVQLLKNVNETFSTQMSSNKITLKDLFDGPTIAKLAGRLSGTPSDSEGAEDLAALLLEIEGMSDGELRAALDGNRGRMETH